MIPDWTNAHGGWIHLVWAVAAAVAAWVVLELRGRDALARFLSPVMQARLVVRASMTRTIVRLGLVGVALLACVWALMRPQTRGQDQAVLASQFSADVMIVLDVSRSMLAEDVAPNRLARAKAEISEMVRQLPGHRVGLVAFAGRAALLCPLTPDHSYFNLVLRGVDVNSVARGGTRIGEALRAATAGFPAGAGAKLVVLITDGEDHDSYPLEAAKVAKGEGVRIIAVGLGSETGSPIVLTDPQTGAKTQLSHDGQPVISRLDGDTLRQMATETGGAYVPAGTSALDLESIVRQNVTPILRAEADRMSLRRVHGERFVWPIVLALVALFAAVAVGARARRSS
ncbi:MAG: VWA domain-containing protein [Myxococcales bacterium]|nr:VWA domain-containing protein [Myxococcales bacterium]